MKKTDILLGLAIVAVVSGVIYWIKKPSLKNLPKPTQTPTIEQIEGKLEDTFKRQIPEDLDKTELKDVAGGDGSGVAARKFEKGVFNLTVLADLPDPEAGNFYQVWLQRGMRGEDGFGLVSLGKMRIEKGGYLIDYKVNKDYSDYKQVFVSREKVFDSKIESSVLEGVFK